MERVLIANRGEIALRIEKALKDLGIESVAIYHYDEKSALHVTEADIAVCLGKGALIDTYLNIPKIIQIARDYNCNAIHPGYGFLSENYQFAKACEEQQINFIGPDSEVIRLMGLKSEAKIIARRAGVPVLESILFGPGLDPDQHDLSFPLLIKAVAGGGGKGLKIARYEKEMATMIEKAQREAAQYFNNSEVMVEPYLEHARHIEVQVLGDKHGNIVHLFERECSLQRNHQKIIEEAPAVSISESLRSELHQAAVKFAKELNYCGAGTVEFLISDDKFYFLEMNTRIQVEHPVTELVTGVDLVKLQVLVAKGGGLPENFYDLQLKGHAIEARIYAENPYTNFSSSSGKLSLVRFPGNIRVDTFIHSEAVITPHFDSLLGKIVVQSEGRMKAIEELGKALKSTVIHGVETNLHYLSQITREREYKKNNIYTKYLEETLEDKTKAYEGHIKGIPDPIIAIAFVYNNFLKLPDKPVNLWQQPGTYIRLRNILVSVNGKEVKIKMEGKDKILIDNRGKTFFQVISNKNHKLKLTVDSIEYEVIYSENTDRPYDNYEIDGVVFKVSSPAILRMSGEFLKKARSKNNKKVNQIVSPLFGKIIDIKVKEKDKVKKGDILLTIESMKTENHILSPAEGIITSILVQTGLQVQENNELITLNQVV